MEGLVGGKKGRGLAPALGAHDHDLGTGSAAGVTYARLYKRLTVGARFELLNHGYGTCDHMYERGGL
jgi:hypothetical protein